MSKSNKILLIVLISILAMLIVASTILGTYAIGLYNQMIIDPNAEFASSVEVNEAFLNAYDKLLDGIPIEEVIKDPNLTADQIAVLKKYAEELEIDPEYTGTDSPISQIKPPTLDLPASSKGVINILFLGTDDREGVAGARSDSMIVVSINTKTKEITFTSLLRDMYIELVGLGRNNKLNAAYQLGGVKMLNDTIKTYLGIETSNYVRVDFESFITIIDEFGGIDVPFSDNDEVRKQEIKRLKSIASDFSESQLVSGTKGTYHLTGEQALFYCRDRYSGNTVEGAPDGDFGRTERQRKVLGAMVEKAQKMKFDELLGALPEILPLVTTDLTLSECTKLLSSFATTYSQYTIRNYRIPANKTWNYATIKGQSVLEVNYEKNAKLWREFIYGE